MKVSTRLLVSLLPPVGAVMVIYGVWAQQHREEVMTLDARRETEAYATALAVAFQYGLREARQQNIQDILNLVSRARSVYGILVYDSTGRRVFASAPPPALTSAGQGDLRRVLETGAAIGLERQMAQRRVYSVLEPIKGRRGRPSGVLEVAQPLAHVEAEVVGTRRRFVLNTLTLFAALTLVTLWLVRRTVRVPMQGMVTAVRALGRGELAQRIVPDPAAGELGDLAREFNSMADSLQAARTAAQREAEERLLLERRLRESEKMAAIGTLAAGLAHEIAAPLNVIAGRAAMLLRRASDPDKRRYLEIIVQQTGRITTIVKNLLAYARRREVRTEPVELRQIAAAAAELLDGEFSRSGVAVSVPDRPELWARGDADLLQQVLVNLLLNALQAIESEQEGGRVTVSLRAEPLEDGAARAVVEVADTGPGIPQELREQVFDPFFTTKPNGTGLGLALARSMIEEQGGRIMVAANREAGHGAVFRIELTALPEPERGDG